MTTEQRQAQQVQINSLSRFRDLLNNKQNNKQINRQAQQAQIDSLVRFHEWLK